MAQTYTIRQFAELAGVSVRTLHHYDRIGLLSPERTDAGYRIYRERDLETLAQIVALKFIGVPLKQIPRLLHRDQAGFVRALAAQRAILDDRRTHLGRAVAAIQRAEASARDGKAVDARTLRQIIEVLDMNNEETAMKYQSLLDAKVAALKTMSADRRAVLGQQWAELFADVERSLDEDLRQIRRSHAGRESDSVARKTDGRHSAAGAESPPTLTSASHPGVVCPSPSATV